nr:carboxy-S-adenosyl-L-methionine synthase CmoA [uncultured Helicobacter sp.]
MKDKIFTQDIGKQFEFDAQVASVFDDMLERSIPHYKEVLGLIVDFCMLNLNEKAHHTLSQESPSTQSPLIYDLGSSTGSTLLALYHAMCKESENIQAHLVGIDNSQAMIEKAKLKAKAYGAKIEFKCADLLRYDFDSSRIVLANYILQFIRPMQRQALLQKIYNSLESGGVLIVSEKMTSHHRILDRQMIERYLRYKREQGYTQYEISKKREALENVLIPFSLEENMALLKNVGFSGIEVLFKWVNFGSIIAVK